jgi:glyoxylase-like metal-dependent hydrolase (beta-lactamase superfamily II)
MRLFSKFITVLVMIFVLPMLLQAEQNLPIHKKRLSDKVLIVWTGDYVQTIATVALAAEKGIVVIETSLVRSHDARIRQVIEKEFGRNDFKYLINTHFHHDHTCGNQVYADATIVGHKNIPAGMKQELTGEGLVKLIDKFKGMLVDLEKARAESDPDSDEYTFYCEFITCLKLAIQELKSGFVPHYPSVLFEKSLTLDMGDMTIELYSFGGTHTDSDIVICVPEEGLVAVGDVSPDKWMPYIRKDLKSDFAVTLEHWGRIVNAEWEIKYVNMAHSDMFLSVDTFKEQYRYLRTLWQGLTVMASQKMSIDDAKKKYVLEKEFPYFWDKKTEERRKRLHTNNLEAIWERISK